MTEYVILFKKRGWGIRALLSSSSHPDSEWVAIPSRSFQPMTVTTETKTALKFS